MPNKTGLAEFVELLEQEPCVMFLHTKMVSMEGIMNKAQSLLSQEKASAIAPVGSGDGKNISNVGLICPFSIPGGGCSDFEGSCCPEGFTQETCKEVNAIAPVDFWEAVAMFKSVHIPPGGQAMDTINEILATYKEKNPPR